MWFLSFLFGVVCLAGNVRSSSRSAADIPLSPAPDDLSLIIVLLRMYNVKCPTYTEAYQPISDDNLPQSRDWLKNEDQLVKYIMSNTGLNGSLSDLADVADNIQSIVSQKINWDNILSR
uniref:Uncharacterized protein n=1 Tax=Romanomermis culicivorax TaxID=13658 RepID=A0A915KKP9_ROMCU